MKKLVFAAIIIVLGVFTFKMYNYYAPPTEQQPYLIQQKNDDTLHIAYIGDSWAFMHKDHKCQIPNIIEKVLHTPVKVHSFGLCGQTSKGFYESLFENCGLKEFLLERNYACCFISLGINDTYKKMSTVYYQYSMVYIINFLLENNIYPIIMEIPDYDIKKAYDSQKLSRKILRNLSMYINDTPKNCKQSFRNALDEIILKNKYTNKVSIIRYKSWNNSEKTDLKTLYLSDGMHLKEKGYLKLDSCISNAYIKHCNNKMKNWQNWYSRDTLK